MSHNGITMLELMLARLKRLKCLKPIIIATSTKKIDKKIIYLCKKKKLNILLDLRKMFWPDIILQVKSIN